MPSWRPEVSRTAILSELCKANEQLARPARTSNVVHRGTAGAARGSC